MLIPVYEAPLLPFFYFPKSLHSQVGKKVFFTTFFPGFLECAFHPGLILKTFSKGKKIIFSLFFCNIDCLWGINFPQHFVPKDPDFFFTCNISLVFKIVLQDWNESEGNFNLAQAILKFPEDSFQSFRTILKTRELLQEKKKPGLLLEQNSSRKLIFLVGASMFQKEREKHNILWAYLYCRERGARLYIWCHFHFSLFKNR